MEHNELVDAIIEAEWPMFHSVNGEDRADCQDDREGFFTLRAAQFNAWSVEALASYLQDLRNAVCEGRNLAREKYIRMMRTTDPDGYASFRAELPSVSAEKERLVYEIWRRLLAQTERMRTEHPALALGGRPLRARDAEDDDTSLETYQIGELMTYSENTLTALLSHMEALERQGVSLAFEIQRNTVTRNGAYPLETVEQVLLHAAGKSAE